MEPEELSKFKMAAAAFLLSRFRPPFRCYLSDLDQILHTDAFNAAAYFKNPKSEVGALIQDGGGGHLGFFKMQSLSQILTDFDAVKNTHIEIFSGIRKT